MRNKTAFHMPPWRFPISSSGVALVSRSPARAGCPQLDTCVTIMQQPAAKNFQRDPVSFLRNDFAIAALLRSCPKLWRDDLRFIYCDFKATTQEFEENLNPFRRWQKPRDNRLQSLKRTFCNSDSFSYFNWAVESDDFSACGTQ